LPQSRSSLADLTTIRVNLLCFKPLPLPINGLIGAELDSIVLGSLIGRKWKLVVQ